MRSGGLGDPRGWRAQQGWTSSEPVYYSGRRGAAGSAALLPACTRRCLWPERFSEETPSGWLIRECPDQVSPRAREGVQPRRCWWPGGCRRSFPGRRLEARTWSAAPGLPSLPPSLRGAEEPRAFHPKPPPHTLSLHSGCSNSAHLHRPPGGWGAPRGLRGGIAGRARSGLRVFRD